MKENQIKQTNKCGLENSKYKNELRQEKSNKNFIKFFAWISLRREINHMEANAYVTWDSWLNIILNSTLHHELPVNNICCHLHFILFCLDFTIKKWNGWISCRFVNYMSKDKIIKISPAGTHKGEHSMWSWPV